MEMLLSQSEGSPPVTILRLLGNLDGSNYLELIEKGKELYAAGVQRLLVDLSAVKFMSSAGLVALHSLALIFRGSQAPNLEAGFGSVKTLLQETGAGKQAFVKLLNPSSRVADILEMSGMDMFFEIYTDQSTALNSY